MRLEPHCGKAEVYRAFSELGRVWAAVGRSSGRADVAAHAADLLTLAPQLHHDLHASLNMTVNRTISKGDACYSHTAEGPAFFFGCPFRAFPEMFYSGALTAEQTESIYRSGMGLTNCTPGRFLGIGSPAGGGGTRLFSHIPHGWPYGLLVHDMVERFLLHFFTQVTVG